MEWRTIELKHKINLTTDDAYAIWISVVCRDGRSLDLTFLARYCGECDSQNNDFSSSHINQDLNFVFCNKS